MGQRGDRKNGGALPGASDLKYVCIHCGHPVDSLYKQYSSSVLKIIQCENCSEVADKYIEYEPIIVVIDIVLLNREAYRHVLYNTHFRIRWKLAVVLVLLESYLLSKEKQKDDPQNINQLSSEQLFYICFLLSIIDALLLSLLLFALAQTVGYCTRYTNATQSTCAKQRRIFANVVKCVTLGSVTKFFLLPAVIWHTNTTEAGGQLHGLLVSVYYAIALVQIFAVLVNCSRWKSALMVAFAMVVKTMLDREVNVAVELWL